MSHIRFVIQFQRASHFQRFFCRSLKQETRNVMEEEEEEEELGINMALAYKPHTNNAEGEGQDSNECM